MAERLTLCADLEEAVCFLDRWYEDAPRQLVSIVPDGPIAAKCLWPQKPEELRNWLHSQVAAGRNCYFSVNQPGWALDKRAQKSDIRTVRALHVDIDPRPDEEPADCKARALDDLSKHTPPPSVVIDSGNGIQAFWLLDPPVSLDGSEDEWRKIEAYNIGLEKALGADSCFNCDRVMRLPGTVNYPNRKKLAKGREAASARLVAGATNWRRHSLSVFTPAPPLQQAGGTTARRGSVTIPSNLPRFASTDDLPVRLADYTVMLIVNGSDLENPTKYPSRSEALWRVLCDMVRAGCSDETIAAVILDRDFEISASVLDKARPESYAAEQIAAAREEIIHPGLRELNSRHAVIESDRGGRCVVAEEDWDDVMNRRSIRYQTFDAFRNRYMHRYVEVGKDKAGMPAQIPLGKWWLMQEHRRQYRKIVFWPNREVPPEQYNLWRGFGCDAKPGQRHLGFLEHVYANLCARDQALFDYVLNWTARMVQQPDRPGEVALVIRGKKGTGKGFFFRTVASLLGQHSLHVSNAKFVVGDFNSHLRDCIFLFADEAFYAGDKKHEGILKALITEPTLTIEAKGIDAEAAPNFLHVGIASNEDWVVPASADERRYVVLEASDAVMQDTGYFRKLKRDLDEGGREHLLYELLNRPLDDFEVRQVPWTRALEDQKVASLGPIATYLATLLEEGELPNNVRFHRDFALTNGRPGILGLFEDAQRRTPNWRQVTPRRFYDGLRAIGCKPENGPPHGWRFPPLMDARARFKQQFCAIDWSPDVIEWQPAGNATSDASF